jgi:hypothetical protein
LIGCFVCVIFIISIFGDTTILSGSARINDCLCVWFVSLDLAASFRDARPRCLFSRHLVSLFLTRRSASHDAWSLTMLGLAAPSRRSVSVLFCDALVLAVALHRDAILLVACLHRFSLVSCHRFSARLVPSFLSLLAAFIISRSSRAIFSRLASCFLSQLASGLRSLLFCFDFRFSRPPALVFVSLSLLL